MHTPTLASGIRMALVAVLVFLSSFARGQGALAGRILNEKDDPINNAVVKIYADGMLKCADETDCDGNYTVKPLEAGAYDMVVSFPGYEPIVARCVVVSGGATTTLNFQMLKPKRHTSPLPTPGAHKPVAEIWRYEASEQRPVCL